MSESSAYVKTGIWPGMGNAFTGLTGHIDIILIVDNQTRNTKLAHQALGGNSFPNIVAEVCFKTLIEI